jgi:hypothetical protein
MQKKQIVLCTEWILQPGSDGGEQTLGGHWFTDLYNLHNVSLSVECLVGSDG